MKTPFQKNLLLSAGLHGAALGIIVLLLGFARPEKLPERVQWLDLNVTPPPAPSPEPAEAISEPRETTPSSPPQPIPSPEPPRADKEPEIPKPEPAPEVPTPSPAPKRIEEPPAPKPAPKPVVKNNSSEKSDKLDKPKIKISTKTVTRPVHTADSSKGPTTQISTSDIQKKLLAALQTRGSISIGSSTGPNNGAPGQEASKYDWYYALIRQAMDAAWHPPMGTTEENQAVVLLRVEKDGLISGVSLKSSSGDKEVDASVLEAANSVRKIAPPPPGLGTPFAEITVTFKRTQKS